MISSKLSTPSPKALPITLSEFSQVLRVGQTPSATTSWLRHRIIGLAISGGVDSMALASLCAKVQKSRGLQFQAFIVDHDARSGSYDEAKKVSKILLEMGINTEILRIHWPENATPLNAPNFESLARKYRFQALGRACRDRNILKLLLAHHADDQAETVMMRLARGHKSRGLAGISSEAPIPECYGIYGIHGSGLNQTGTELLNHVEPSRTPLLNDEKIRPFAEAHIIRSIEQVTKDDQFEAGGVRVIRPLLPFHKERLIATCVANGTPWFEDSTNKDRTLTPRNAIRHIFTHHSLPVAIQKRGLIELSMRIRRRKLAILMEARRLLRKHAKIDLEPLAGTLTIQFPQSPFPRQNNRWKKRRLSHPIDQRELAGEMLRMAIESITPEEHVPVTSLSSGCRVVFPALYPAKNQPEQLTKSFTVGGVLFERQEPESLLQIESEEASMNQSRDTPIYTRKVPLGGQKWLITRQPYSSDMSKHPLLEIPPLQGDQPPEWNLYDGRYWMRVTNVTSGPMKVRPLRKEDLRSFRAELEDADRRKLRRLLRDLAPGRVRFALPAITMEARPGGERVLALPTLHIGVSGVGEMLDYVVRYKHVAGPFEKAARRGARSKSPEPAWLDEARR